MARDEREQTRMSRHTHKLVESLVLVMAVALGAAEAQAGVVFLRPEARVAGDVVTLGDVAELHGEYARSLAELEVMRFDGDVAQRDLDLRALRRSLSDADVHWGRLTLRGYGQCVVTRGDAKPTESTTRGNDAERAPLRIEPGTLGARIEQLIVSLADAEAEDLRIAFQQRDAQRLALPLSAGRFELEPMGSGAVGRVVVVVRRFEALAEVERFTIAADVKRRVTALVARQTIGRGQRFAAEDFERRVVWLDSDRGQPLDEIELVQGRQADTVLREGTVVYPEHVRAPTLVQRGERIAVRALAGELMVRATARAEEAGAAGDVIRVRNERTRQRFLAEVTGRRQAVVHGAGAKER